MTTIDLSRVGGPEAFPCRGKIMSQRDEGSQLLLLFGERHSLMPFIRNTLLNVIDLDNLGLLSFVGVEGDPGTDIPGSEAQKAFDTLKSEHREDDTTMIEQMLRSFQGRDFYFWKTLVLMRPELKVQSVDDSDLCRRASDLEGVWKESRADFIRKSLQESELFEESDPTERIRQIEAKVHLQMEQEWAEHPVNVDRDEKMLNNLLARWTDSGPETIAVLNAGSSHQWRIPRLLRQGISYYHIEQP